MLEPKCFCKLTKFCQILILTLLVLTPPYFLAKIVQILQKVIVFFLERGKEIEPWFWHIWTAQWLKFFPTTAYLFRFWPSLEGKGGKSWAKSANFGSASFSWKLKSFKCFQTTFLFARALPLVRISAILDYIWRSRDPKTSKKRPFHECWIGTQNFENF